MLLLRIHFRSLTKNFRTLVEKHSDVVVRISSYASRNIVWVKKISYKGARSLGIILQFSMDNFWHGQQKIISFLQRIYRKRTFSRGRFLCLVSLTFDRETLKTFEGTLGKFDRFALTVSKNTLWGRSVFPKSKKQKKFPTFGKRIRLHLSFVIFTIL